MAFVITEGHFRTEEEAYAEIAQRGWHAIPRSFNLTENSELHWHDFNAVVFVVEGTVMVGLEDGTIQQCGAGARVTAAAGVVHQELEGTNYRGILGYEFDPSERTLPINKPVSAMA